MFARDNITYEPVALPDRLDYSAEQSLAEACAFHDRMKQRHTVRDYADRPVSREVIEACIRTLADTLGLPLAGSYSVPTQCFPVSSQKAILSTPPTVLAGVAGKGFTPFNTSPIAAA